MQEIYRGIPGFTDYEISTNGIVISLKFGKRRVLKQRIDKGYYFVGLRNYCCESKKIKVHLLMAMTFLNHKQDGTNKIVVDHKDNIKSNNKLQNLQLITHRLNCSKDNKGLIGANWHKINKKWCSQIQINGKYKWLGYFTTAKLANKAYQNALKTLV